MPTLLCFATGLLGLLCLCLAAVMPWFQVPLALSEGKALAADVPVVPLFRLACVAAAGLTVASYASEGAPRKRAALLVSHLLVILLFFPYLTMTWCPAAASQASWLQAQHENMSWLGGDIYNAQELRSPEGKLKIVVADPSRQVGVFKLPNWSPYAVQGGNLPELVEWLGYSNRFCQFVSKGWILAVGGCALLLLSLCRGPFGARTALFRILLSRSLLLAACCAAAAALPPLAAGRLLTHARGATCQGEYGKARHLMLWAARLLPIIRQDTYYTAQLGLVEHTLGLGTPEARLSEAGALEKGGFVHQALEAQQTLLAQEEVRGVVRREAVRGILRAGIRELNTGNTRRAEELLAEVLAEEPCNLKAHYSLQLACLRSGNLSLLRASAADTAAIYAFFNFDSKKPVLAAVQENLAYAALREHQPEKALQAWRKTISP